jgi:GT2 family glycosyltransferase
MQAKVWIVLVNWNGWRDSVECLESVFRQRHGNYGVILCDNASDDGSVEQLCAWAAGTLAPAAPEGPLAGLSTPPLAKPLPHAVLDQPAGYRIGPDTPPLLIVRTGANLGFAGGNNVGIRIALSDPQCAQVWLLNNDTVIEPDTLLRMQAAAAADERIGITGSLLCFYHEPDRIQALGGGMFSRYRVYGRLLGNGLRRSTLRPRDAEAARAELDWVSGASMLVSRAFLEQVGEMEERYFLYFEEIDWAWRSRQRFRPALAADAVVYHKAGAATGERNDSAFSVYTMCRSRYKLYRKFVPALLPACYLRAAKEMLLALLRGRRVKAGAILRASRDDMLQRAP